MNKWSLVLLPKMGISQTNLHEICTYYSMFFMKAQYQMVPFCFLIFQKWDNPFLSWNPVHYNGIKVINVDPKLVWKPDLVLYNKWVHRVMSLLANNLSLKSLKGNHAHHDFPFLLPRFWSKRQPCAVLQCTILLFPLGLSVLFSLLVQQFCPAFLKIWKMVNSPAILLQVKHLGLT